MCVLTEAWLLVGLWPLDQGSPVRLRLKLVNVDPDWSSPLDTCEGRARMQS
jgi:hypothetical protein